MQRETRFRKAIPIEKRAAITLWRLETGNSYRSIAKNFAFGAKSTAVEITNEFYKCITEMVSDFIVFPKTERETAEAIIRFAEFSNCKIPQVVGVIDGVQIEVLGPRGDSKVAYFNRKQHCPVNTQATIGANLVFLDLATGFPGSLHDSRVLQHSTLYRNAELGRCPQR